MSNKKTRYFVAVMGAILAVGLGTGLVASYMGLPVSVFSSAAGPDELQYVPADAAVVAYANVREVMNSQFRQRFKSLEPSQNEKNDFEEKTGLNLEQDVDSIVAAVMPKDGMAKNPAGSFLILARARYQAARLEALALEHGAEVSDYNGKRLITHHESNAAGDPTHGDMAFGFIEADLVAFGSLDTVKAAIDARASNRNIVSNNDMMKLVNEIDNANAWAVGKFDAIANKVGLPSEMASAMPAISWFSAAGHVNGGISGSFKAEAKDEATAKNLRDMMAGFLAMAKMQASNKPGMQQLADSLVISGEGNSVALAFSIPSEVLDVLEGLAKGRHPQLQQ
ncbi:MAG TPA: hypothetical protein VM096_04160 [Vicinamibacterales bacterium]|nr:hypothetical protein [Vicinamibacterales bacterium]